MRRILFILALLTALNAHAQPAGGPDTLWTQMMWDYCESIWPLPGGTFLLSGHTPEEERSYYLRQVDSQGQTVSEQAFAVPGNSPGSGMLLPAADGGWTLVGFCYDNDIFETVLDVIRLTPQREILWHRSFTNGGIWYPMAVSPSWEGGVLVAGVDNWTSMPVAFVLHVAADGDSLWFRHYPDALPGTIDSLSWVRYIFPTADSSYLTYGAGTVDSVHCGRLQHLNRQGDTLGTRYYCPAEFCNLTPLGDDVVTVGVGYPPAASQWAAFVARLDAQGNERWRQWITDTTVDHSFDALQILVTLDGRLTVAGYWDRAYTSFLVLSRLTADGELLWQRAFRMPDLSYPEMNLAVDDHGRYLVTLTASYERTWLLCTAPDTTIAGIVVDPIDVASPSCSGLLSEFALHPCYPNPFNSTTQIRYLLPRETHVSLTVFDVTGREVDVLVDRIVSAGEQQVTWAAEGAASGVYFVRLDSGTRVLTRKVLLVR